MRSRAEWWDKANSVAEALSTLNLGAPTIPRVALLLSVAEHETRCGDAWPGEHNWGATTLRALRPAELAALAAAGVHPVLSPSSARRACEEAATRTLEAAGLLDPHGALHVDSRPSAAGTVVYLTYFRRGADDVDGARYFAGFFKTQAERAALAGSSPYALARAMYAARYFTGFHANDPEANIADYAAGITPIYTAVTHALEGWTPGAEPPAYREPAAPEGPDMSDVRVVQAALNRAGASPPLVVDGALGPKTRAALVAFQRAHHLSADGVVGPATTAALRAQIGA